jgi:hypothetical protein
MSTNGITIKDKKPRNLRTWAIVGGTGGDVILANLDTATARHTGRAPAPESLESLARCFLGSPCFFPEAYAYVFTPVLGPGSDLARGVLTGFGVTRTVLPLGLYGKTVGIMLIPSTITLLEDVPDEVVKALSLGVDSADDMNARVMRGPPRIQLAGSFDAGQP